MFTRLEAIANGAMATVIALYMFGGDWPLVSTGTAVSVGSIMCLNILAAIAMRPLSKGFVQQKKLYAWREEAPANCAKRPAVAWAAPRSGAIQRAAGISVVFAAARLLRLHNVLTEVHHTIAPALALGCVAGAVSRHLKAAALSESCDANDDWIPYPENAFFRDDLDDLEFANDDVPADPCGARFEEDPEEPCADVYLRFACEL